MKNLLNIFKKQQRITPSLKTTYPPDRNRVVTKHVVESDDTKRITIPKEPYNNSGLITGIKYTVYPDNRPTINQWAEEVKFSIDYEKTQYEQFKQHLMEKSEQLIMNKQYNQKFGVQKKTIPLKTKIFNFLNRHL